MIEPSLSRERRLWRQGFSMVAGVDEVGRGAWAGPLVAAAVCLPVEVVLDAEASSANNDRAKTLPRLLRDSKKLTPIQRTMVADTIKKVSCQWAYGLVEVEEINTIGIGQANELAMIRAMESLPTAADFVLIDGTRPLKNSAIQQEAIVKGDSSIATIAAASILAKVYRDELMCQLALKYPEFSFDQHKGYGTKLHQQAIMKHGLSPLHRVAYKLKFLM